MMEMGDNSVDTVRLYDTQKTPYQFSALHPGPGLMISHSTRLHHSLLVQHLSRFFVHFSLALLDNVASDTAKTYKAKVCQLVILVTIMQHTLFENLHCAGNDEFTTLSLLFHKVMDHTQLIGRTAVDWGCESQPKPS